MEIKIMDTSQIEQRIEDLEKQLKDLQESSSIPTNIENALIGRGFLKTSAKEVPPGDWDLNSGFIVSPGGTNAQAPATRYLRLLGSNGSNYWIPLLTFSELGG